MHSRMTVSLDSTIYEQFTSIVPLKSRSQFVEALIKEAILKKRMADKDAEYAAMSKDPDFLAEEEYFMDFSGDVQNEAW